MGNNLPAVGAMLERHVRHCWPQPWIEAAISAGFAHYKGDGEWVFINDKMRDMLADFANAIAEHAEQAQREEDAALVESRAGMRGTGAWVALTAAADAIRNAER